MRIWALGLVLIGFTSACTEDAALDDMIDDLQEVPNFDTDDGDDGDENIPGAG